MTTEPASPTKGPRKSFINPGGLLGLLVATGLLLFLVLPSLPIGHPGDLRGARYTTFDQIKEIEKSERLLKEKKDQEDLDKKNTD